ncbi:hypothetical protein RUM43_001138 [Polyplax serrata]|uniref:Major facilitator superfamily (MFS) profile domain-containing protein n=1 Tax=Polyplax serrata TaxID=468196 RepID=A0AAN8SDH9_POLSC
MPPQEKISKASEPRVVDDSELSEPPRSSDILAQKQGHVDCREVECLQCRNGYINAVFVSDDGGNLKLDEDDSVEEDSQMKQNIRQIELSQPNSLKSQVIPEVSEKENLMDFDELLPYVGEFGTYQKLLFFFMIPFAFFVAWVYFSQIFMTLTPEKHWCLVPELQDSNLTLEQRMSLSIPRDENSNEFEKCRMYGVNFTEVLAAGLQVPDPSWPKVPCQSGWEYDLSDIHYPSIVTELNWVCEQSALASASQSIFFVGSIFGGLIFGWVADSYGRIPALVGTNLMGFAGGIATAGVHSFWSFCLCRFFVGLAFDNCFTMMYILVLEYVGPKWRTFVANMSIAIFFTIAACVLPWIAIYVSDWRIFCIITSSPLILAVFTPWMVPESARWLVSQGRVDKAIDILKKFEKVNKTHVDDKLYKKFREDCQKQRKIEEIGKNYSVLDLFSSKRLRRTTILLILIWMAISLVFDGHVRSVGALGLDVFLTFTIACATEFPADTFLTIFLDKWGRRWLACGSMVVSGIFSLLSTAVPVGAISASLAIIGRFAVNVAYNIGLQYAAEVLPTVVRAQGVALIHIMGYVASILAPFVVYLGEINTSLPLLILGVLGIGGGILSLFLPETLDQELPQTLEDGENFGKDQQFWNLPCIKRQVDDLSPTEFKRSTQRSRASINRVSLRGETLRSSMILRSSLRSRKNLSIAENAEA